MISAVSSMLRVVWVRQTTFRGSGTRSRRTPSTESTTWIRSGASPRVPMTSSWSAWPISTML